MGTRFERCLSRCLVALKLDDSPDFRLGGREGGGRRAALVADQPARIVAECVDAQMPPHLHVRTESSQVVLDFAFGIGKNRQGEPGHTRDTRAMHTGARCGTRITQTNLITMYHPNPPTHPHDTARRPVAGRPRRSAPACDVVPGACSVELSQFSL